MSDNLLNRAHVRRRFARAAAHFSGTDFVHRNSEDGLFERLQPMTIEPSLVLDLGCGVGASSRRLQNRFRKSRVLGVDLSPAMLGQAPARGRWFSRNDWVCADAQQLPLGQDSVDLVFANMLMPWIDNPDALFAEVARVLRPEGLFVFSALGPDSLGALRAAWAKVDDTQHVHPFPDMHNLGDGLIRAGMRDPVLDVDELNISYKDPSALMKDLAGAGARNSLANRHPGLTGKGRYKRFLEALQGGREMAEIVLSLELVFGHAFGGKPRLPDGEFRLSPSQIGRRKSYN